MMLSTGRLGSLALTMLALTGCVEQADDQAPDADGAVTLDGKADGAPSRTAYAAVFSPGLLQATRPLRLVKGLPDATVGYAAGVGCHVQRDDTWKTKDLLIAQGTTYSIAADEMSFLRFSSGQLGFSVRLREYPADAAFVPLKLYCWATTMPTADAVHAVLFAGGGDFDVAFTPSTPTPSAPSE